MSSTAEIPSLASASRSFNHLILNLWVSIVSFPIFGFLWYRLGLLALRHSIVFNSMSIVMYSAPYITMELCLALSWLVPFSRSYY